MPSPENTIRVAHRPIGRLVRVLWVTWALSLTLLGIGLTAFQAHSISRRLSQDMQWIAHLVAAHAFSEYQKAEFARPKDIAESAAVDELARTRLRPLVERFRGMELIPLSQTNQEWFQTLPSPLDQWAVQPSPEFLRAQEKAILYPMLVYVGLTVLALATILIGSWFVMRVARREVALAELKSNFVADVSHELKTPLAMIQLFAETLQSGRVVSEEKRQEYFGIISRESSRLTTLINNILDFARIEAGRRPYTLEPVDVAAVVREIHATYRDELDRHGFEHEVTTAEGLPAIQADRDAVAQILINLMSNAIKYSTDERVLSIDLRVDTRRGKRGVLLSVEDRGIGIRPEDQARVFEGFFRATDGRVLRQGGTGLGLTLVKHIVDAHGGTLDIEPRLLKGTAFRIFLPAADSG